MNFSDLGTVHDIQKPARKTAYKMPEYLGKRAGNGLKIRAYIKRRSKLCLKASYILTNVCDI